MKQGRHFTTTEEVRAWWESNPFTFGAATNDYRNRDLVGKLPLEKMNLDYFQEIERRFRKHSGTGAQLPDELLLSKLIDYDLSIKDKKVLDIATGSGLFAVAFAQAGANVTAIDLTDFAVRQTKKNLALRNLEGLVLRMDAQKMDLPPLTFQFINAWGCLMHMPDTFRAISNIYRLLVPRGRVVAYMYNKNSWPFWFNIVFLRGILLLGLVKYKGDITRLTSRYSDGASVGGNVLTKFFTPKEVTEMFERAGFKKVKVFPWDIGYEPNHWPMRTFPIFKYLPQRVKAWMSKRWGYGLIIMAEK